MDDTAPHSHRHDAPHRNAHSHIWLMSLVGVAVGAGMMVFLPQLKVASTSILLFAGFHVLGGIVLVASAWTGGVRNWVRRWARPAIAKGYDFGWGPGWMNGLAIAALVSLTAALVVQLQWPAWWPISLVCTAMTVLFLVGNQIMRGFRRYDHVVLPMVDLVRGEADRVLDVGCGSGRTTIALARVLRGGTVTAVDRFDAGYIDDGGRALLKHNLALASLTDRVSIERADLTEMPFEAGAFDAAVSAHVYDHLGAAKQRGLDEVFRVLRPGGRFLMAVWTPGWSMFAVANVFSLLLTSKARWRDMAAHAGFATVDEGMFNSTWFVLLEKPIAG